VLVLSLFALLTLFLSSSIILDLFNIREKEGNYVPFVVWANFISSILYIIAAVGIVKLKKWPALLLLLSAIILIAAFIGLKIYISNNGIYELKTVSAMIFRIALTIGFSLASYFLVNKSKAITAKNIS
jgi:heme/copper-type cytochrome/quinol oxidase subunit 3